MGVHPVVLKEMESVGWIKRDEIDYAPTERGKDLAQQLLSTGKYNERIIAQAIDPSIPKLSKDEEMEMMLQELNQGAHEQLMEGTACLSDAQMRKEDNE